MDVKGVSTPVRVLELAGAGSLRPRFGVSRSRGLSRFVGRNDEAAALDAALKRALAGDAPVAGVVAEAGVGKSRLCHEFIERTRAAGLAIDTRQSGFLTRLRMPSAMSESSSLKPSKVRIAMCMVTFSRGKNGGNAAS